MNNQNKTAEDQKKSADAPEKGTKPIIRIFQLGENIAHVTKLNPDGTKGERQYIVAHAERWKGDQSTLIILDLASIIKRPPIPQLPGATIVNTIEPETNLNYAIAFKWKQNWTPRAQDLALQTRDIFPPTDWKVVYYWKK